ncbi:hypothetical protein C8C98_1158 [Acidovorax sp. 106]|nr:hypothetical protein C8C98_1158 [Acidovorax sp. 106]
MPVTLLSSLTGARAATPMAPIDREALRQRVQEASARPQPSQPAVVGASTITLQDAATTASLVWSALPPDRAVPPDNTYSATGSLTFTSVTTTDWRETLPKLEQLWANAPAGDAISRQMESNQLRNNGGKLASQWNGLGGALLSLAAAPATGPVQYQQTLLMAADPTQPLQAQFAGLQRGATTVNLQIKTRSGQTVDLQIAANNQPGQPGQASSRGLQVSVNTSGPLSDNERQALAALSQGLEEALAGLGDEKAPAINLSGLLAYDRSVFSQLDLDIQNPTPGAALGSFAFHLGDSGNALSYQGAKGKLDLRLDANPPLQAGSTEQRQAAIAQQLQLIDDAAERSHADETLVALFKSSFAQLQGAAPTKAADTPLDPTSAVEAGLTEKAQPLLSGLVDFEASFSGDFAHPNRWGSTNEKGHAQYAISQKTAVEVDHKLKTVDIAQTQSEQLQSRYAEARFDGVLDMQSGNFDRYSVQDRSTVTTLINAAQGKPLSAARTTDRQQLETHETLVKHRVVDRRETPNQQHLLTVLL